MIRRPPRSSLFPGTSLFRAVGLHNVVARDGNLCLSASAPVTIGAPALVVASPVPTDALCFGATGSINVTATGGNSTYQFSLDPAALQASRSFLARPLRLHNM